MNLKALYFSAAALGAFLGSAQALTLNESGGWFESAYVEWAPVSGAVSYNVYCDGERIDDPLVRTYASFVRADVPGLAAGSHTIKVAAVTPSGESSSETATANVTVKAHDRTGFAFDGGRIPGAYKVDGTLKNGAVVLYVSEYSKETISLDVTTNAKGSTTTCKTFQGILNCLKKGYESRPIDFRLIGNVTDSDSLVDGDVVVDLGSSENASVTIEGIGEDATANGWGIRLKNAQNVEIRNLGIMNVNSGEGDNIGLQQNNAYIWVHHNDFFYGDAGSDADQAKGDGALDCKKSSYVTFSYNHFWDNGKSNLLGLSEKVYSYDATDYYITYHHNWYDHSDSRHPRVRYYNAHVYNNYYDGNAKYGAGSTLGSSVFMEGNYFRNCKYPMLTSMQGSDLYAGTSTSKSDNGTFSNEDGGVIKAFDNYMEGNYTFIPYGATSYVNRGTSVTASSMGVNASTDFDAYVVSSRSATVPNSVKSKQGGHHYSNFDTDSKMYSYTAEAPEAAKVTVETYAGRMNGGDFSWTFDNDADDASYAVNAALKSALSSYTGSLKSIQGGGAVVVTSSASAVSSSSAKSSSSSGKSSSSAKESSSSAGAGGSTLPIFEDTDHDFTEDALSSDYFAFLGNLSTAKGSITVGGKEFSRCLKMESSTSIDFTLAVSATVTLYFNTDFTKTVRVNRTSYTANAGVVSLHLDTGDYTITKGDGANLYWIVVEVDAAVPSSSASVESSSSAGNQQSSSSESAEASSSSAFESSSSADDKTGALLAVNAETVMTFDRSAKRLVTDGLVRQVEVFSANGNKVLKSTANSLELSKLPGGVYLVRASTGNGFVQMKIEMD